MLIERTERSTAGSRFHGLRDLRGAFKRGDVGAIASGAGSLYQTWLQLEIKSIHAAGVAAGVNLTTKAVTDAGGVVSTAVEAAPIAGVPLDASAAKQLSGEFKQATDNLASAGEFLGYLNIVNSLAKGDVKSAVIAAISLANPILGAILSAVDLAVGDTFAGSQAFSARGFYREKADGTIEVVYADEDGEGQTPLAAMMKLIAERTNKTIATKPMNTVTRGVKDTKSACLKTLRRQKLRLRLGHGVASCQVQVGTLRQAMMCKYHQLETLSFMSFPFKR